jgi:hypothetical protein
LSIRLRSQGHPPAALVSIAPDGFLYDFFAFVFPRALNHFSAHPGEKQGMVFWPKGFLDFFDCHDLSLI